MALGPGPRRAVVNFRAYLRRLDAATLHQLVIVMSQELARREGEFRSLLGPTLAHLLLPESATVDHAKGGTGNAP